MQTASVTIPWPDRRLSPNARVHWTVRSKVARAARYEAQVLAVKAGLRNLKGSKATVSAVFNPPDRRGRDIDNMFASVKPKIDGIADVLGIDDRYWEWSGIKRGEPSRPGHVTFTIELS